MSLKLKPSRFHSGWSLNEKGYTWVELMFALMAIGLVVFTALSVYKVISRSYWQVEEKSRLERALVFTMEQMVEQIRQARTINIIGPITPASAVTVWGVVYPAGVAVAAMPMTTVHLDAAGARQFSFSIPHLNDPLKSVNDATLTYFLRQQVRGAGASAVTYVQLYQRMRYYDGTYTQAFPAMANTDQFRLGVPVSASILKEPTIGVNTPVAGGSTPTAIYNDKLGRMAGGYASADLSFDDVSFFYNRDNGMVAVGLTLSLKSKSLSWMPSFSQRRKLSMTSTVALRRSQ
jgi:hypothetical protein